MRAIPAKAGASGSKFPVLHQITALSGMTQFPLAF